MDLFRENKITVVAVIITPITREMMILFFTTLRSFWKEYVRSVQLWIIFNVD